MKPLLILPLAPLLTQSAERPAWEVAPRWECQMEKLRLCEGLAGTCETKPNSAFFTIDFDAQYSFFGTCSPVE